VHDEAAEVWLAHSGADLRVQHVTDECAHNLVECGAQNHSIVSSGAS
jgi:hypothetical protein